MLGSYCIVVKNRKFYKETKILIQVFPKKPVFCKNANNKRNINRKINAGAKNSSNPISKKVATFNTP